MKKKIILGLSILSLIGMNGLVARGGGDAFAGGLAGSMVGGLMSGAMTQPREKTVVVQQPVQQPVYTSADAENARLKDENARLRDEIARQTKVTESLERRLERLEEKK